MESDGRSQSRTIQNSISEIICINICKKNTPLVSVLNRPKRCWLSGLLRRAKVEILVLFFLCVWHF